MSWFLLAVVSTVMSGVQTFMYKASAQRNCNKFIVAMAFLITQLVAAVILFVASGVGFVSIQYTLVLAAILAAIYFTKVISDFKAMESMPTNQVVPIVSSNIIIVVLFGLVFLNEQLKPVQILGTVIVIVSVLLINIKPMKQNNFSLVKAGLIFAIISMLGSAGTRIINKYAAVTTSLEFFNLAAQVFLVAASLATFGFTSRKKNEDNRQGCVSDSIKVGILTGIFGSVAYISYLFALRTGPLSVISTIQTLSTIITVGLAWLVYKEELTRKHFALIILSVIGVILLRI